MNTRIVSPGKTTGFSAFASSLMFITPTPWTWATLFRLKSLVTILAFVYLGQLDQFQIDFFHLRKILVNQLDLKARHFLNPLQHVQSAAASIALHGIGGVGHKLQFPENKLGNHKHAFKESGFGDVGNAPVDNDTGIEKLDRAQCGIFGAQEPDCVQVKQIGFTDSNQQTDIAGCERYDKLQERHCSLSGKRALAEKNHKQQSKQSAGQHAGAAANKLFQSDAAKAHFKQDSDESAGDTERGSNRQGKQKRPQNGSRYGKQGNETDSEKEHVVFIHAIHHP